MCDDRRDLVTSPFGIEPIVSQRYWQVAIYLYIDHEPNDVMAHVGQVRIWDDVKTVAEDMGLSSRLMSDKDHWARFDDLKEYIVAVVPQFVIQTATEVVENKLMVALMRMIFSLMQLGFYETDELVDLMPILLDFIDGSQDKIGLNDEEPGERYCVRKEHNCNTSVIHECKLWACRVLALVCTMRVDLRLSQLLAHYKTCFDNGNYAIAAARSHPTQPSLMRTVGRLPSDLNVTSATLLSKGVKSLQRAVTSGTGTLSQGVERLQSAVTPTRERPYVRLDLNNKSETVRRLGPRRQFTSKIVRAEARRTKSRNLFSMLSKASECKMVPGLFQLLSLEVTSEGGRNLLAVLVDLTYCIVPCSRAHLPRCCRPVAAVLMS